MPFVLDASISACWLLPDENEALASQALNRLLSDYGLVPEIWWFEMRNLLLNNERSKRITANQTAKSLILLSELPINIDHAPNSNSLIKLARQHKLSIYDSAYLELALRHNILLATLDKPLAAAATKERVLLTLV